MGHTIVPHGQVRSIRANYRSVTGTYNSFSGPLQFESQLERDAYLLLDFEPFVSKIQVQPLRLGNYTPDCLIVTNSEQVMIAEIKYKQELAEKWQSLKSKFEDATRLAAECGATYGFITDESVYADRNRLDFIKWIKFITRDASNKLDVSTSSDGIGTFSTAEEVPLGKLAKRIGIDQASAIQQVCLWISSKRLCIKSVPTQNPMDAILSSTYAASNFNMPVFVPYSDFVESMEKDIV